MGVCAKMAVMSSEPLLIPVDDLRRAVDLVLRHVEASAGPTVALTDDLFWSVPADALHDIGTGTPPGDLTIGQLSESWGHVADLLAQRGEGRGQAVGHHLVWLADVMRAIGHDVP